MLSLAERASVSLETLHVVVNPFGDLEELRSAMDHDPTGIDAGSRYISDHGLQQLRDAASARGRVHVPDHPSVEHLPRVHDRGRKLAIAVGIQDLAEEAGRHG